jgi:hypothetical protein
MDITGLTLNQFCAVTNYVSETRYGGNVVVHQDAHERPDSKDGTPRCTARLAVLVSRGPGSRASWTGRHGPYACWHAYRDVLAEVFRRYPNAVIRAGMAWRVTYRGMEGFLATYPETANRNVGSQMEPVTMPELCNCDYQPDEDPVLQRYGMIPTRSATGQGRYARLNPLLFVSHPDASIRTIAIRLASDSQLPARTRTVLNDDLGSRLANYNSTRAIRETAGVPGTVLPLTREDNPNYVSPAVMRASRVMAASAELLEDRWADQYVFGPPYDPGKDPYRYRGE